jgi:hypothetical protein
MACRGELKVLIEGLEKTLDQSRELKLEHLQFLLSMAFMEAEQQLSAAKAPLRLVACNDGQG